VGTGTLISEPGYATEKHSTFTTLLCFPGGTCPSFMPVGAHALTPEDYLMRLANNSVKQHTQITRLTIKNLQKN